MNPPGFPTIPCALTIAGSDSGGGAGIQADLKTFQSLGVHGLTVITCITAQNPDKVAGVREIPPTMVRQQLEAVESYFAPECVKIGMLYSVPVIHEVSLYLARKKEAFVVLDPVMISTSGRALLSTKAIDCLVQEIVPHCSLLTPNLPEAEYLLKKQLSSRERIKSAVRELHDKFGCFVLLKGGHSASSTEVIDIYWDGQTEDILSSPRIKNVQTHGTGCTYASAICAKMATKPEIKTAIREAHSFVHEAIKHSVQSGRATLLHW
ncbi:MAG: thiD [Verrucomicrobiales bacterium]|jgi:hydroxymethylpyrimidine/phosphomethylpyrimidine kinase|nr:thiD [Verrucomicrobiales bacterium]